MIKGPLAGIRIVEFDAIGPVPLVAMLLSDYGCDVVRITRRNRPDSPSADGPIMGRGRNCVKLNLKHAPDCELALRIIASADAVLEGSRPGAMERLGLGPSQCLAANSKLVYGRMTGWGQTGPLAKTAGHDINYIALTGVLHSIGFAQSPIPPLNLVGDYAGGAMFMALGVCAALISAKTTGEGQVVDAAMTDGSALLMSLFYNLHARGEWRHERGSNLLDGGAPFYRTYACRDDGHVAVGAIEPAFFAQLIRGLGLEPTMFDQNDRAGWETMTGRFAARFVERDRDDWAEVFRGTDACVTPVLSLEEAARHPHNQARGTFGSPFGLLQPMPAPRFSQTPASLSSSRIVEADDVLERWQPRA